MVGAETSILMSFLKNIPWCRIHKCAGNTLADRCYLYLRRSMIEAIDNYEGDDPLRPWLQYVIPTQLRCPRTRIQAFLRIEFWTKALQNFIIGMECQL